MLEVGSANEPNVAQDDGKNVTSTNHGQRKALDGGYGWVIVFASFMVNSILDGILYSFATLLIPLIEEFDSNRSTVSWAGSLLTVFHKLACPVAGALVKRFDCRKVCIMGCIIGSVGFGLSTVSPNIPFLLIFYGVIGAYGLGTMYLPSIVIVNQYFDSKRGLATGIADAGSGLGSIVVPILATQLIQIYGWQGATLSFGILCLIGILFGIIMVPFKSSSVIDVQIQTKEKYSHLAIWKNPFFLLVAGSNFFGHLGMNVPYTYLPDAAVIQNISTNNANYLLSVIGVTNTVGRIAFTAISDIQWLNPYWIFASSIFLCGIFTSIAPICYNYITFVGVSLGFGFFSSCWALTPILLVNDLGLDNLSQAMGYMMIFKGSLFLGPPIGGVIYDATESYDIAFFMAGSVYAIATFFSVIAACLEMRKKKKSKKDLNEVETGGEMVGTLDSISALFIAFAALAEIKKDVKESTKKYLPGDENEVTHL